MFLQELSKTPDFTKWYRALWTYLYDQMSSVFCKLFSATLLLSSDWWLHFGKDRFLLPSRTFLLFTHQPTPFSDAMKFHPRLCCLSPTPQGNPRGTTYVKDKQCVGKRDEVHVQVAAGEAASTTSTAKPPWPACTRTEDTLHVWNGMAVLLQNSWHGGTWMGPCHCLF